MSELFESPEQSSNRTYVERAGEYLRERLKHTGSLEALVLALQHDFSGDKIDHTPSVEKTVRIMGEPSGVPAIGEKGRYEDDINTGQLYQLLRIAEFVSQASHPTQDVPDATIHSFYAGELIAMSVADFVSGKENDIPSSMLSTMYKRLFEAWEIHTHGFDFSSENDAETLRHRIWPPFNDEVEMRRTVAKSFLEPAGKFSENPENIELKELIDSLLNETHPTSPNILLVQRGFWMIMREWLSPDFRSEEENRKVLDASSRITVSPQVYEGLAAAAGLRLREPAVDNEIDPIDALEAQFSSDGLEMDIEEWNRESLYTTVKDIVYRAGRIRAAGISLADKDRLDEAYMRQRVEMLLDTYAREEHGFHDHELFYAHGTFVGLANGEAITDGTYEPDAEEPVSYLYQMLTEDDYRTLKHVPDAEVIPYEVRGMYRRTIITEALRDVHSYKTDVNDENIELSDSAFDYFTPAILLEQVSVINMETGEPVDHFDSLEIPLTHSRLQIGRFVPPLADDE